jgi:RNA polymerase sigma factor (sigma-70 family)
VQNVWAEIISVLPEFEYDPRRGRFSTWLYTLVRSKATDLMRKLARDSAALSQAEVRLRFLSREEGPAQAWERFRQNENVRRLFDHLSTQISEVNYRILRLRFFEERTPAEIAEAMGLTPDQVRYRNHRLKRKLRGLLHALSEPAL